MMYEQNIAYRVRKIGGKSMLIGESTCYELNELASEIWGYLEEERTISDIVGYLAREYDVDKKVLQNDIIEFMNEMVNNKVIQVTGGE